MHTYLVNFKLYALENDEKSSHKIVVLTKNQSLAEVETLVSEHAKISHSAYTIKNTLYLGTAFKTRELKESESM
ncbi:hypothetical protein AAXE64_08055 [Priestia megaterium]